MTGVSVTICCYNSSKRLPKTLDHLKEQEVPSHIIWEVIVVFKAKLAPYKMHKNVVADIRFGKWETFTNNL